MLEGKNIQYQIKLFTYPMGQQETVVRVNKEGLDALKTAYADPKSVLVVIPTVQPSIHRDGMEFVGVDQEYTVRKDNLYAFYVTPIDTDEEKKKYEEETKALEDAANAKKEQEKAAQELKDQVVKTDPVKK